MVFGIALASAVEVSDNLQLLAMGLVGFGFAVILLIPVVREIVVTAIRHPTRTTPLKSPSMSRQIFDRHV
jgi:hypothetical protein